MRNLRKLAGPFDRELTKLGDIVTANHVSFTDSSGSGGLNGEASARVVKDLFTGFLVVYPSDTKAADQVFLSLQHFLANTKVKTFVFRQCSGNHKGC